MSGKDDQSGVLVERRGKYIPHRVTSIHKWPNGDIGVVLWDPKAQRGETVRFTPETVLRIMSTALEVER